jgi:hypothetical protein
MKKECRVCGEEFIDGDLLAAVMLSTYKAIESDVHFAITQPTQCLEIFHLNCYDGDDLDDREPIEMNG